MTTTRLLPRLHPEAGHLANPDDPNAPMRTTFCGWELGDNYLRAVNVEVYYATRDKPVSVRVDCEECLQKICRHCHFGPERHVGTKCLLMETHYEPSA